MTVRLLIDGYNVIRQSASLRTQEDLSLELGRKALLERTGVLAREASRGFFRARRGLPQAGSLVVGDGLAFWEGIDSCEMPV